LKFPAGIQSTSRGGGAAGNISVKASTVSVLNNAKIDSSSDGNATAGGVTVETTTGDVSVKDGGAIAVSSTLGDAVTVKVTSLRDIVLNRGTISATANQDGGNVSLTGRFIRAERSQLVANAEQGTGGRFTLSSLLFVNPNSPQPRVDSRQGQAGVVDVRNAVDLQSSLGRLPESVLSDQFSVQLGCERNQPFASSLEYSGLLSTALSPSLWMPSRQADLPVTE
jgi:hypothetical protein